MARSACDDGRVKPLPRAHTKHLPATMLSAFQKNQQCSAASPPDGRRPGQQTRPPWGPAVDPLAAISNLADSGRYVIRNADSRQATRRSSGAPVSAGVGSTLAPAAAQLSATPSLRAFQWFFQDRPRRLGGVQRHRTRLLSVYLSDSARSPWCGTCFMRPTNFLPVRSAAGLGQYCLSRASELSRLRKAALGCVPTLSEGSKEKEENEVSPGSTANRISANRPAKHGLCVGAKSLSRQVPAAVALLQRPRFTTHRATLFNLLFHDQQRVREMLPPRLALAAAFGSDVPTLMFSFFCRTLFSSPLNDPAYPLASTQLGPKPVPVPLTESQTPNRD